MQSQHRTRRDSLHLKTTNMTEREVLKESLHRSEQKLRQYLDNSPDAIYVHDLNGKFLYGNHAAERMIGYSKEELIGKSFLDLGLLPLESLTKAIRLLEFHAAGKPTGPDEFELIRKDGSSISVEISTYPVGDGNNIEVIGIVRDISERKRLEHEREEAEALRRTNVRFKRLVEEMNDGYFVIQDYKIVFVNSRAAEMFGYTPEEVVGKPIDDYLTPSLVQQLSRVYGTGLSGGIVPPQYQITLNKRDGTPCQVELGAKVTEFEGKPAVSIIIRDITDRKFFEKALTQKEQDYLVLLESTDENIIVVEADTLRIVFGNRRAARTFGFDSVQEALGSLLLDFIHPDDRDTVIKAFLEDPYNQDRRQRYQVRAQTKDGKELWVSALATRIDFMGKVAVLLSLRDITESKLVEDELHEREEDYLSLLEHAYDAMVVIDIDSTQVVYGNLRAAKLFGFDHTNKEGIGLTAFDVIHPEDLEVAAKALKEYYTFERPQFYEVRVYTSERRVRWVHVFATRINWKRRPAALLTLRDITERKDMEIRLSKREQDYLILIESTDENIIVVEAETLKIIFGNSRAAKKFGFDSVPEALGSQILDFIHPDDRDRVIKAFLEDPYERDRRQRYQVRAQTKDGKELWVSALATRIEFEGKVAVLLSLRDVTESKRLEDVLRDSEQKLRLYFENVTDVIYSMDSEFRVTSVSPSAEKLLGYKPEELIGKPFPELNVLAPEYLEAAASDAMRVMAGERIEHSEYEFIHKDGRRKFGQVSGAPLLSQEGKVIGLVSVARDITERRNTEEALRQSEEHYSALVSNITDALFTVKGGVVTWCNDRVEEIYGYPREELLGKNASFFYPSETSPRELTKTISIAIKEQGVFRGIANFVKKDGSLVDIEYSLTVIPGREPLELVAVARDVTERRKAEERIRDSEEKYRSLVETSSAAVFTTDSMGLFTFVNEAGCKMSGYSREELLGIPFTDLVHPDDNPKILDLFSKALQGVETPILEFRAIRKDGNTVWCYARPNTVTLDSAIIGFSSIIIDITQQRNMEEQLQRAGRLAAVGELAAGVAHELNNPLAAIQGFAQLLAAREDVDEILKKDLQTIYREAKRAASITKNLLSFSRGHDSDKRLVYINEVVEETLELVTHQLKVSNIEVVMELQPDLPMTMIDYSQIRQVFLNIINNANQAMTEAHGRGKLIIRTIKSDEMLQVIFIDSGPGIPKENLPRIFDPFFTTKGVGKGTGLGLSVSYGILKAHGGHIYVSSDLGKGATFTVEIPVSSEDKPVGTQIDLTKGQGVSASK